MDQWRRHHGEPVKNLIDACRPHVYPLLLSGNKNYRHEQAIGRDECIAPRISSGNDIHSIFDRHFLYANIKYSNEHTWNSTIKTTYH